MTSAVEGQKEAPVSGHYQKSEVNWQLCRANGLSWEREREFPTEINIFDFSISVSSGRKGLGWLPVLMHVCLINVDCKQRSTSKVSTTRGAGKVADCYLHLAYNSAPVFWGGGHYRCSKGIKHLGFLQSCAAQIFALKHNSQCSNKTHTSIEGIFTYMTSSRTHNNNIIFCLV